MDDVKRQNLEVTCELARRVARTTWRVSFPFALLRSLALARKTGKVFLAPPGGSSPPAILGHINAVFELREQCNRNELPIPDYILCPFGSGGTAAGLSIGLTLAGWPTRLVAVRVVDRVVGNRFTLRFHIRRTLRFLRSHGAELPRHVKWAQNVEVVHHCFGCGYGEPSPDGERCRELAERHEGLKLDCTYTAKTLAALLNQKESGRLAETTVLFWHTLDCRELPRLPERLRTQMKTRAIA
ncbi:MAG: pyridoxal-phosphate dependent enzyme [Calditrichaeota bacterium]|nr:MAG: pyridoxal-phosphate dependent enzyme [Calditrichota bacterium]